MELSQEISKKNEVDNKQTIHELHAYLLANAQKEAQQQAAVAQAQAQAHIQQTALLQHQIALVEAGTGWLIRGSDRLPTCQTSVSTSVVLVGSAQCLFIVPGTVHIMSYVLSYPMHRSLLPHVQSLFSRPMHKS